LFLHIQYVWPYQGFCFTTSVVEADFDGAGVDVLPEVDDLLSVFLVVK
jgi:hypothetical protein